MSKPTRDIQLSLRLPDYWSQYYMYILLLSGWEVASYSEENNTWSFTVTTQIPAWAWDTLVEWPNSAPNT